MGYKGGAHFEKFHGVVARHLIRGWLRPRRALVLFRVRAEAFEVEEIGFEVDLVELERHFGVSAVGVVAADPDVVWADYFPFLEKKMVYF